MVSPVAIEILLGRVRTFWDQRETGTVFDILRSLHRADNAGILYLMAPESQKALLQKLPWQEAPDVLEELDEEEMVDREALTARVVADQEEVARILSRYNLLSDLPALSIPKRIESSSQPR